MAIDGKVLRGAYAPGERGSALHLVSAYATANKMVIGQVKTQKKSNEITAIPELIKLLEPFKTDFPEWAGLKTLGVTIGYRQENGKLPSLEYRYYISSARLTEEQFSQAVRSHWQIENNLHWVLDVTFKEDDCQIYRENAAENIAILRRISLNILKKETSQLSIKAKRRRIWMKTQFLERVLQAGFANVSDI